MKPPRPTKRLRMEKLESKRMLSVNMFMELNTNVSIDLVKAGEMTYFTAADPQHGVELWKIEEDVASLVRDIVPGPAHSNPQSQTPLGNHLVFTVENTVGGVELWKTDGSRDGTARLGVFDSAYGLTSVSGTLYFAADDGEHGIELWQSDGTNEGTRLVSDIYKDGDSSPTGFRAIGDAILYTAVDDRGRELWRTDGTAAGTSIVKDIDEANPITPSLFDYNGGSSPRFLGEFQGYLFFSADDGVNGTDLWRTDGTAHGTVLVKVLPPSVSGADSMLVVDDHFVFQRNGGLWISDGTEDGTNLIVGSLTRKYPRSVLELNGNLLFIRETPETGGEFWVSNGTSEGTTLIKDIASGSESSDPRGLVEVGDNVVFTATTPELGRELWTTDGTESGTELILDVAPGTASSDIQHLQSIDGKLYFTADDGSGRSLWRSDGTNLGTSKIAHSTSDEVQLLEGIGAVPYVVTVSADGIRRLSYVDAHEETFSLVSGDFVLRSLGVPAPINEVFTPVGDNMFLIRDYRELWVTNGTASSTHLVREFDGSINFRGIQDGAVVFNVISDGASETWMSDGTVEGTQRHSGETSDWPKEPHPHESLFSVDPPDNLHLRQERNMELRVQSELDGPTRLVKEFGSTDCGIETAFVVGSCYVTWTAQLDNGDVLFPIRDGVHGTELWRSDGTTDGTVLVADIFHGERSSISDPFPFFPGLSFGRPVHVAMSDRAVFVADDGQTGHELWTSDGTQEGTYQIADIWAGSHSSSPNTLKVFRDSVWFLADDGIHGAEVWVYHLDPPQNLPGDADGNGQVDFTDFLRLSANFGKVDAVWADGDFDASGTVDFQDFLLLAAQFGT